MKSNLRNSLLLIAITSAFNLNAQRFDYWIGGGTSTFLGDLGGKYSFGTNDFTDLDILTTRYSLGTGFRFMPMNRFGIRVGAYYARVSGDDKYTTNVPRNTRNLSFFSPIFEANATLELHVGPSRRGYFFAGVGMFKFNPKAKVGSTTYALRELGTEGQYFMAGRSPYKTTAIAIPFGAGYKLWQNNVGGFFAVELWLRKTNTDYIDDVSTTYVDKTALAASNGSTAVALSDRSLPGILGFSDPGEIRGDPTHKDNYTFIQFTYNHPLQSRSLGSNFYRGGRFRKYNKCPTF